MSEHYAPDGSPLSTVEWGKLFEKTDRTVAVSKSWDGEVTVSTVYLGLDYSFGSGPPLIYETMVFGGEHDDDTYRYPDYESARVGHLRVENEVFGYPLKKVTRRFHDPRT